MSNNSRLNFPNGMLAGNIEFTPRGSGAPTNGVYQYQDKLL